MVEGFKKLAVVMAILMLTGYLGNLLLDNPYMHSALRKLINGQLREYTHLQVSFQAVGAKFMPPGLEVYGVEVDDAKGKELLRASHIKANISYKALLFSRKELFELEVTEPRANLPFPPVEELLRMEKFPELKEPSGPTIWPPKRPLPFYRIAISNGQLSYQEMANGKESLNLSSSGIDSELLYNSWNSFRLAIGAAKTNLVVDGYTVLRDTSTDLRLKKTKEGIRSEVFRIDSQELNSLGEIDIAFNLSAPTPAGRILNSLEIKLEHQIRNASLAPLARLWNDKSTDGAITGIVKAKAHIPFDGSSLTWELHGDAKARDARLMGFRLFDSHSGFEIKKDGVKLNKISVIKDESEIAKGQGFISFKEDSALNFDIQPQNLSMRDLMSALQVDDFEAFEAKLGRSNIKLTGQMFPFHLEIRGPVIFEDFTFPFVKDLGSRFQEPPRCELAADMKVTEKVFTIVKGSGFCEESARNRGKKSPLDIHGDITFDNATGMNLIVESNALDGSLLPHFIKLPAEGPLDARVSIAGPYDRLNVSGDIASKSLTVSGLNLDKLSARFRLPVAENKIVVEEVQAKVGTGSLAIQKLMIGFAENLPFEASADIKGISSSSLAMAFEKATGKKSLRLGIDRFKGSLQGDLLKPLSYRGEADLAIKDLGFEDQLYLTELKTRFKGNKSGQIFQDGVLRLDRLEARFALSSEYGKASTKAKLPSFLEGLGIDDGTLIKLGIHTMNKIDDQFRVNSINPNEDHLGSLPFIGKFFQEQKMGGIIDLDTDLEGPVGRLQGKIDGAVQRPFVLGMPIPTISFSGFLDGTRLQIPEFRHAGNSLVGRLNVDFGQAGLPYDFYIYLKQFDARALPGKFFAEDPRNYAYVTAEWNMNGKFEDFWKSRGELTFIDLRSKLYRNLGSRTTALELNSSQAVKIDISPEKWTFDGNRPLKFHGDFFEIEISTGNNRLPDNLDIKLSGSVKLDILKGFSALAETARGELKLDGYLRGSLSSPEYSMRIQERKLDPFNLKDYNPVALGLVNLGPALSSVSLDVEVKQDRLIVNRFRASKGREGTIEITGTLLFDQNGKDISNLLINLDRIEFNRLQIPVLKSADTVISGDLTLSGNQFPFNLSGNLVLDRFQSIGSFDLRREIVSALYETKVFNNSVTGEKAQTPYVNLDIGLSADRSILVKNKTIEANLSAQLRVRGTDTQPLLLGQVIADSGTFNYRRAFKITQAVVSFDEPVSPPNPRLDISGEAVINPYKVNIQVGGYLQAPKVTLASDPPTREDGTAISNLDIVLLITTGKISETTNKSAEKASVNELFSSFLVFAEEPIEKLFDMSGQTVVREVYIDSYIPEESSKNATSTKSGQQRPITRFNIPFNLFNAANAVVQVDDEANSKILFEYPLHEGITFTGSLDRKANKRPDSDTNLPNDTGFDLKFRFGFD